MTQLSDSIVKRRKPDAILLIIVIIIGVAGLFSVLKFSQDTNNTILNRPKTTVNTDNVSISEHTATPVKEQIPVSKQDKIQNATFTVLGEKEAGQKLTFSLQNTDPFVQYELQVGKSNKVTFKDKTLSYSFPRGGTFPIQLIATYQGKSKVIQNQNITIANSIEVVSKVKEP